MKRRALIIFALLAAIVALYIAMAGNLSRPYWAMGTVYIVSQPLLGPTRAKGVYRILGTLAAGLATLLMLPALVKCPPLPMGSTMRLPRAATLADLSTVSPHD